MGTSGALNTSNDKIKYTITITQNSQSIVNNTSNVTVSVKFYRTNTGYTTYGTGTVYCKINGTKYSESVTSSDKITNSGIVLFTKTLNIPHGSDGVKKLTVSAWIDHQRVTSSEQSYSMDLTTIPRASTFTSSGATLDSPITFTITRKSTALTHKLTYKCGSLSGYILGSSSSAVSTESKSWTPASSTFASLNTTGTTLSFTFTLDTYSGSTKIGTNTKTVSVKIPSSVKPSVTIATEDAVSKISSALGVYVKGYSKLKITATGKGIYGSSIKSYKISANGASYSSATATTGILNKTGDLKIDVTVTDSRGYTGTDSITVNVKDYAPPDITKFSVERCNPDGTNNDEGTSARVTVNAGVYNITGNTASYKVEYKASGTSSYTTKTIDSSSLTYNGSFILNNFDTESSYDFKLTVADKIDNFTAETVLNTAFTLMDYHSSGKGMAIGKVATEPNALDIALPIIFRSEWTNLELDDAFIAYSDNDDHYPQYKKIGNIVMIKGIVSPKIEYTSTNDIKAIINNIPSDIRPPINYRFIMQGSGKNTWLCDVRTDGKIYISRYGVSENTTVPANAWLNIFLVYMT